MNINSNTQNNNNEWILSKPTWTGSEQWRFVPDGNKIALYHTPENAEEYSWGPSMSLEQGRATWRNMVERGFNFNREEIVEAGKNGNN